MKIVNPHLAQDIKTQGMIMPPNTFGYIQLACEVEKPAFLRRDSKQKKALLKRLKGLSESFKENNPKIRRADVFTALVIPPGDREGAAYIENHQLDIHIAQYDIVLLIECDAVSDIEGIAATEAMIEIENLMKRSSSYCHKVLAKNPNRIAEVDKDRQGVFLFNYFYSQDQQTVLDVWQYTAGWWTADAKLDNSTPLLPLNTESEYSLINHCRWDRLRDILPTLVLGRLGVKPGLNKFVLKNFTANGIVAMPVLYKLA